MSANSANSKQLQFIIIDINLCEDQINYTIILIYRTQNKMISLAVDNFQLFLLAMLAFLTFVNCNQALADDSDSMQAEVEAEAESQGEQDHLVLEEKLRGGLNLNLEGSQQHQEVVEINGAESTECIADVQQNHVMSTQSILSEEIPMTIEAIQLQSNEKSQESTGQLQQNGLTIDQSDELQLESSYHSQSKQSYSHSQTASKRKQIKKQKKTQKRNSKLNRLEKQIRLLS